MAGGGYIFLSCCPLPMAMRFGSVKEQTIIGRHPITKHHTALWLLQAEHWMLVEDQADKREYHQHGADSKHHMASAALNTDDVSRTVDYLCTVGTNYQACLVGCCSVYVPIGQLVLEGVELWIYTVYGGKDSLW